MEQETDGRWIAETPQIPGGLAYGDSKEEAILKVETLVLRVFPGAGFLTPEQMAVARDGIRGSSIIS